jgi:OOP family OmpA-OmpF porin
VRIVPLLWALVIAALLAGCAGTDLIVVIPESDGHVGAVVVQSGDNKILLDKAYAAAASGTFGATLKPVESSADEVHRIFDGALAAQPVPPQTYTLYFETGNENLVPESQAAIEAVFADIGRRRTAEIVVTGHTDTVGQPDFNDRLSLQRAETIAQLLIARGLPPASVTAVGRGERELLVPTGDQVAEARNRRVEITVR